MAFCVFFFPPTKYCPVPPCQHQLTFHVASSGVHCFRFFSSLIFFFFLARVFFARVFPRVFCASSVFFFARYFTRVFFTIFFRALFPLFMFVFLARAWIHGASLFILFLFGITEDNLNFIIFASEQCLGP